MKALQLDKNKYGLRVWCSTCRKQHNEKTIKQCKHPEKQTYKAVIYKDGKQHTHTIDTRDLDDAVVEAINFKKELSREDKVKVEDMKNPQLITVADAAEMYLKYRHGIGVPEQYLDKLDISDESKKAIVRDIKNFVKVLNRKGYNTEKMPFCEVGETEVSHWFKWVKQHYGQGSWKSTLDRVKPWFGHMINKEKVMMADPMYGVTFKRKKNKIEALKKEEFEAVLNAVDTADPWHYEGAKSRQRKKLYYDWLKDAFKLGLYAGTFRNEELSSLKWSDVQKLESGTIVIASNNFKVENKIKDDYTPKVCVVYPQLQEFLESIGMNELIGTDHYIISPIRSMNYETLAEKMSKAWSHYWKKAFPTRDVVPFKYLRKTYLSYESKELGADQFKVSSHSDNEVLRNHYLDPVIAANAKKIVIFG